MSANTDLKFTAWVMLCFLCLQLHSNCPGGTTYQTWLQAIQNQNKLIDFSDYISYSYVSYLHFWNYPRPPFLFTDWLVLLCLVQTPRLQTLIRSQNRERGERCIDKTLFPLNTLPLKNMNFSNILHWKCSCLHVFLQKLSLHLHITANVENLSNGTHI